MLWAKQEDKFNRILSVVAGFVFEAIHIYV